MSEPWFEIYPSYGQWRWRLRAGNSETIASGEAYVSKSGAQQAVNLVQQLAPVAGVYEVAF